MSHGLTDLNVSTSHSLNVYKNDKIHGKEAAVFHTVRIFISVMSFVLIRSIPATLVDFFDPQPNRRTLVGRFAQTLYPKIPRKKRGELGADLPAFYVELDTYAEPRHLAYEWNPVRKKRGTFPYFRKRAMRPPPKLGTTAWKPWTTACKTFGRLHPDKQAVIDAKRTADRLLYADENLRGDREPERTADHFWPPTPPAHRRYTSAMDSISRTGLADSQQTPTQLEKLRCPFRVSMRTVRTGLLAVRQRQRKTAG